jgi:hypothetical protein
MQTILVFWIWTVIAAQSSLEGMLAPLPAVRHTMMPPETAIPQVEREKDRFKLVEMANLHSDDEGDVLIPSSAYETPEGTRVIVAHERQSTAAAARDALKRMMNRATKVTQHKTTKGNKGKVTSERAVVVWTEPGTARSSFGILWTDKNTFYWITSVSLPVALEFEMWYQKL